MKQVIETILTDLHLKEENADVVFDVVKQAVHHTKEFGLNRILFGGDLFNSRKAQSQYVLNTFGNILDYLEREEIELVAIPGNHDKTDYAIEESFLDPFITHSSFSLHKDTSILVSMCRGGEIAIYGMPFFSDAEYIKRFEKFKNMVSKSMKSVLITHIGVNGAVMNNGMKVSSGITEGLFAKFDKVFIGHYHDKSYYSNKIEYIGSSIQHNYGENEYKGLTVLCSNLSTETIPLKFPKYVKHEIDAATISLKQIRNLKTLEDGNNIRIILTGKQEDVKSIDKQLLLELGVDVKVKQNDLNLEEIEERIEAFDDESIYNAFKDFCTKNELSYEEGIVLLDKVFKQC